MLQLHFKICANTFFLFATIAFIPSFVFVFSSRVDFLNPSEIGRVTNIEVATEIADFLYFLHFFAYYICIYCSCSLFALGRDLFMQLSVFRQALHSFVAISAVIFALVCDECKFFNCQRKIDK